jgi:CheY-like chemotaxis protein
MPLDSILIAEDNLNDLLFVKYHFRREGILNPLRHVSDGGSVIKYLEGEGGFADRLEYPYPILLLLDLKMPGKSGFEVLEWLQHHPRHGHIPVIVLTGCRDTREVTKAYHLGAQTFLTKPISFIFFKNCLRGIEGVEFTTVHSSHQVEPCIAA